MLPVHFQWVFSLLFLQFLTSANSCLAKKWYNFIQLPTHIFFWSRSKVSLKESGAGWCWLHSICLESLPTMQLLLSCFTFLEKFLNQDPDPLLVSQPFPRYKEYQKNAELQKTFPCCKLHAFVYDVSYSWASQPVLDPAYQMGRQKKTFEDR